MLIANLSCGHTQEVPDCVKIGSITACDHCSEVYPTNSEIISVFKIEEEQ